MKYNLAAATSVFALLAAADGPALGRTMTQTLDPGTNLFAEGGPGPILFASPEERSSSRVEPPRWMAAAAVMDPPARIIYSRGKGLDLSGLIGAISYRGGQPGMSVWVAGQGNDGGTQTAQSGPYVFVPSGSSTASFTAGAGSVSISRGFRDGGAPAVSSGPAPALVGSVAPGGSYAYAPIRVPDGMEEDGERVRSWVEPSGMRRGLSATLIRQVNTRLAASGMEVSGLPKGRAEQFRVLIGPGREEPVAAPLDLTATINPGLVNQSLSLALEAVSAAAGTPLPSKAPRPAQPGTLTQIGSSLISLVRMAWGP